MNTRQRMIETGQLKPSEKEYRPGERPEMSKEVSAKLKARLIAEGVIVPQAPQVRIVPKGVH